jgi:hypothetical protein
VRALRWSSAAVAAAAAGFAAVGCWYAALLAGLDGSSPPWNLLWFFAAAGALGVGFGVWAWLLPVARGWGVLAVLLSAGTWFVLPGGRNTF